MDVFVADWLNLILRWAHLVVGIGWIGTSFYFIALDLGLRKDPASPAVIAAAVAAELLIERERAKATGTIKTEFSLG